MVIQKMRPAQNAKDRDQIDQALCGSQSGFLRSTARLQDFVEGLSGKGLARYLRQVIRFQPLPIGTAREVFPQAARPVSFVRRVMGPVGWRPLSLHLLHPG